MEADITRNASHSPATSPQWADYYQRAKEQRKLGKGQHARIRNEMNRRRRREKLMLLAVSTAMLVAVVGIFYAILGAHGLSGCCPRTRPRRGRRDVLEA